MVERGKLVASKETLGTHMNKPDEELNDGRAPNDESSRTTNGEP
jgi:hypothetical protein